MKDTPEELNRLEQELLADTEASGEAPAVSDEPQLEEVLEEFAQPAAEPEDCVQEPQIANEPAEAEDRKKNDRVIVGLMIAACVLCAGIIGILVYWLNAFLA